MQVEFGVWRGREVRRARKEYRCEYWRGADGRCVNHIRIGDHYVEGEMRDGGNPFARERYCMKCAGAGARASVTLSRARAFGAEAAWWATHGGAWITARNAAHDAAHLAQQALTEAATDGR